MPNFPASTVFTNSQVKLAQKGIFRLPGNKLYSSFHKTAVLGNIRVFVGSKTVTFGSNEYSARTKGQLFP